MKRHWTKPSPSLYLSSVSKQRAFPCRWSRNRDRERIITASYPTPYSILRTLTRVSSSLYKDHPPLVTHTPYKANNATPAASRPYKLEVSLSASDAFPHQKQQSANFARSTSRELQSLLRMQSPSRHGLAGFCRQRSSGTALYRRAGRATNYTSSIMLNFGPVERKSDDASERCVNACGEVTFVTWFAKRKIYTNFGRCCIAGLDTAPFADW
jgi:hypothetical protein